jgi:hypothetical protein
VSTLSNPTVTTGHLNGVITVNLEEADDTYRQINRQQLGETAARCWGTSAMRARIISGSAVCQIWRGMTRCGWRFASALAMNGWTTASALSAHYQRGAPAGWEQSFITAYAASHPWEDWAETWAHYLQIVDGLETCESLGIQVKHLALPLVMLPGEAGTFCPRCCRRTASPMASSWPGCNAGCVFPPCSTRFRTASASAAVSVCHPGACGAEAAAGASFRPGVGRG